MGPYLLANAMLVGFFLFGAIYHFILWSRSRGERTLFAFAILAFVSSLNSYAIMRIASAETMGAAQRALDLRAVAAATSVVALTWLFSLMSGVRARWFVWLVTVGLMTMTVRGLFFTHLTGLVTGVRHVATPWGETLSALDRGPASPLLPVAYAFALAVPIFGYVCARRLWTSDRMGGTMVAIATSAYLVSALIGLSTDLLGALLPYLGPFVTAFWILPIAWQVARANRLRDEQLLSATHRFRAIFDQTFQFIGLMDVDGTLLEANQSALAFAEVSPQDVIGKKFWDTPWWTHSPDAQARLRDAVLTASRGQVVRFETTHNAANGRLHYFDFSLKPVRNADGAVTLLIPEGRDITERRQAEDALRRSEERFRFLIQNQTEFVVSCRHDASLTFVNDSFSRYFGLVPERAAGTSLLERFVPDDRASVAGLIGALTAQHPVATGEWRAIDRQGQPRWTQWTISGVFDDAGAVALVQMTGRDIHDRVTAEEAKSKLEQQLLQAQKLEALGQLAGGVAHDFNNLLTVIAGHADMLLMTAEDPDVRHDLSQIRLASERAASMTRQLLAFSRQSVLEPKVINLNTVVAQTEAMLRRTIGEDIELTVRAIPNPHMVKADPDQLARVLINTAINARDAMPDGGKLVIETRNVTFDPAPGTASAPSGDYVLLAVSDTGCGITPESKAKLFEPFFTTKGQGKGTGLGLSVVDGIIKQSGGWIDVESELDAGTTFRIYLPAASLGHEADTVGPDNGTQSRGHETVLLVEDEAAVREVTQAALERHGYRVLSAASGADALEIVRTSRDPIDVVLTDVVMPGMSGPQLVERLREEHHHVTALFMSGYTSDAMLRHGVETGEAGFIQKPFTATSLVARLRQAIDRR